jgi:serine/threonine-protein kinase
MIKSDGVNEVTLQLLEKGFFQTADRAQFLRSLQKHAPAQSLSTELLVLKAFGKVPTYTALWLDEFSHHRGDDSLTVPDGVYLADGQYQVLNRLGAGGQSVVYEAKMLKPDSLEPCVLKEFVLPSRGGYEISERALDNIQREYALLKSVDNQDIVKAFDLFVEGGRAYLVMERILGANMRTLGFRDDFDKSDVVPLAIQMSDILAYLHSRVPPIVHCDFTPDNLLLTPSKRIKLIDFNIAFSLESNNTKTVAGKHAYIPPEQFRGKPTVQSDIYSFGATLYFLLMGKEPEPITRSVPECDDRLAGIIGRCTEPMESMRYPTIELVKQDLLQLSRE